MAEPAQAEEAPEPVTFNALLGLDAGTCASLVDDTYRRESFPLVQIIDAVEHLKADGEHYEPPKWTFTIFDGKYSLEVCAGFHLALAFTRGLHYVNELVQLVGAYGVDDAETGERLAIVVPTLRGVRRYEDRLGKPVRLPGFKNDVQTGYADLIAQLAHTTNEEMRDEFNWVAQPMRSVLHLYGLGITGAWLQGEEIIGGFDWDWDRLNALAGAAKLALPPIGRRKKEDEPSTQGSSQASERSTVVADLLSGGALASLLQGTWEPATIPHLQVLSVHEEVGADGGVFDPPRVTLVLSNGVHLLEVVAGYHLALSQAVGEFQVAQFAIGEAVGFRRLLRGGEVISIILQHFRQVKPFGRMIKRPIPLDYYCDVDVGYDHMKNHRAYDFSWVPDSLRMSLPMYALDTKVDMLRHPNLPVVKAAQTEAFSDDKEGSEAAQAEVPAIPRPPSPPSPTPSPPGRTCLIDVDINAHGLNVRARVDRVHVKNVTVDVVLHDQTARMDMVIRPKKFSVGSTLEVGKVYNFHNLSAVASVAKFCCTQHRAQLSFDVGSSFDEVGDEHTQIPERLFEPLPLSTLAAQPRNKTVDVVAVIGEVSNVMRGKEKEEGTKGYAAGGSMTCVDVWMFDQSLAVARLVAFEEFVDIFKQKAGYVVLIQDVVVDKRPGDQVCLKTQTGITQVFFKEEGGWHTYALLQDLAAVKDNVDLYSHLTRSCSADGAVANRRLGVGDLPLDVYTVKEINERKLGLGRKPDTFRVRGYMKLKNEHITYPGCASSECNLNISYMVQDAGTFFCKLCGLVFAQPAPKYYLVFNVLDEEGGVCHGVAFNTAGKQAFGVDASVMRELADEGKADIAKRREYQDRIDQVGQTLFYVTFQASTETNGPFKGRKTWIAIEFVKVDE